MRKTKSGKKETERPVVQRLEQTACRLACMHCRSVAEANGVSFVWIRRPVVWIRRKRHVVWHVSDDLSSASAEVKFSLNKTTSFWTGKTTSFWMKPAAPAGYFQPSSSFLFHFFERTHISLSFSLSHPTISPISLTSSPAGGVAGGNPHSLSPLLLGIFCAFFSF